MITLFAIVVIVLGVVAARDRWGALILLFAGCALVITFLLGTPRPIWTTILGDRLVIAADFYPGKAIYIWVRGDPPVAFSLPWSEELAQKIQAGMRGAESSGLDGIRMRRVKEGYSVEPGSAPALPPATGKPN